MARTYDGSRRIEQAQRTREAILEAAFRLHGQGNLDTGRLAQTAGVSVATVRKHFPTRELLFEGCTAFGLGAAPMPDLQAIAAIDSPVDRTRETVGQLYVLHEALLGQIWGGFKLESDSPAMAASIQQLESLVAAAAQLVKAAWAQRGACDERFGGFVHGLLSPLTYRALRIHAGMTQADAAFQVSDALIRAGQESLHSEEGATHYR